MESHNLILIGSIDTELILELDRNWRRLGFFAHFQNGNIVTLNAKGDIAATYGTGVGLIQATQNPWHPNGIGACESVVWMVSGTDEVGVKAAVDFNGLNTVGCFPDLETDFNQKAREKFAIKDFIFNHQNTPFRPAGSKAYDRH